jgi:hypothetical protein
MEVTDDDSVEQEDPRELSPEEVATFLRSLGTAECFQLLFIMNRESES